MRGKAPGLLLCGCDSVPQPHNSRVFSTVNITVWDQINQLPPVVTEWSCTLTDAWAYTQHAVFILHIHHISGRLGGQVIIVHITRVNWLILNITMCTFHVFLAVASLSCVYLCCCFQALTFFILKIHYWVCWL